MAIRQGLVKVELDFELESRSIQQSPALPTHQFHLLLSFNKCHPHLLLQTSNY